MNAYWWARSMMCDLLFAGRAACSAFVEAWRYAQQCRTEAEQHYAEHARIEEQRERDHDIAPEQPAVARNR